jgi:hypothetical protein
MKAGSTHISMLSASSKDGLPAWHHRPNLIDSGIDDLLASESSILLLLSLQNQFSSSTRHSLVISELIELFQSKSKQRV